MTALSIGNTTVPSREYQKNTSFENLYHVEKGRGCYLTYGLRKFNQFFERKIFGCEIQQQNFSAKTLKIVKLPLNIALYPSLGTLALFGVLVNKMHVHQHNQKIQREVQRLIESGCFLKYTYENPLFSNTSDANELRSYLKQSRTNTNGISEGDILQCRREGVSSLKEYVKKADQDGTFIKKVLLEYSLSYEWMADSLNFKLEVTRHRPESQFYKKQRQETALTLLRSNQITLKSLTKE